MITFTRDKRMSNSSSKMTRKKRIMTMTMMSTKMITVMTSMTQRENAGKERKIG
jgi:hypothetical protein